MGSTHLGVAKMGEFFFANCNDLFINALLGEMPDHKLWAGDPIVLLGGCAETLSAGSVTNDDSAF
jgi:hypothetical protein